jgi:hypothetical protein
MHRGADRVLSEGDFDGVFGLLDLAGDPGVGVDDTFGGERFCRILRRRPSASIS